VDHSAETGNFLKEFLPLLDRGSCVNFADNSRSCGQILMTTGLPQSGKLPVLNLLTVENEHFHPLGDLLHRFT